jgi:peptidoglycan/xylan/chitin deacetylase (PgdA/CDA1 family)
VTGTFCLTFDTELIWGSFDSTTPAEFERRFPDVRGIVERILRLLERHEVPATWAVVGHLFLGDCARDATGLAHPELAVRPQQRWRPGDWYAQDPGTDRRRDPLWYGDDIIDAILAATTPQEIGCHSFSHVLFGDPDLTRAAVDADLDACLALATRRGITLRSFVFPRNVEGHHDALRAHGFTAYRGADPTWYGGLPVPLARAAHLLDQAGGMAPPTSVPSETLPGLWNIPGSALLIHRTGIRRGITMVARMRKAKAGLRRAAASGGAFHLWTHPFNLASDADFMLRTLDAVLVEAVRARDRGEIRIETMGTIADRASGGRPVSSPG